MIFLKDHINCCLKNFRYYCIKKSRIYSKPSAFIKIIFLILSISIIIPQLSCGLFYVENAKKTNSSEVTSDNSISSSSLASVDNEGLFENENFSDHSYTVNIVIDGDTIELKNNMRIRLIGINTPEKDMYFFEESKSFMEILVLGKQVKLERDVTDKDMYGRYLRYVYLPDIFINLEMVKSGFANAYTYPPDIKYTDIFVEAQRWANENMAGLWQKSPSEELEVVLNYDAEGPDTENLNGEWVSLRNSGLKTLDLNGWTLKDAGTNIYKFDNFLLKPKETFFLFTGSGTDSLGKLFWNSSTPIWNNKHDVLYIRDDEGLLVYLLDY